MHYNEITVETIKIMYIVFYWIIYLFFKTVNRVLILENIECLLQKKSCFSVKIDNCCNLLWLAKSWPRNSYIDLVDYDRHVLYVIVKN